MPPFISSPSCPVDYQHKVGNILLLVIDNLRVKPHSGRILRGFLPYMDICHATQLVLVTQRSQQEPWADDTAPKAAWQEVVHWNETQGFRGCASNKQATTTTLQEIQQAFAQHPTQLVEWAAKRWDAAIIQSTAPFRLKPCFVNKPWGREVWWTGIENRGVARATDAHGSTELPYALGLFPAPLVGVEGGGSPILLKMLEPAAEDSLGDLYLEVHQEKWEAYVVLSVEKRAWPSGEGQLLAGVNPKVQKILQAKSAKNWETTYQASLQKKIEAYEQVRKKMDAWLDKKMGSPGVEAAQQPSPASRRKLLSQAPAKLSKQERTLRQGVEDLLGRIPLKRGDVVHLPPGVLHSLRRGVRVIEFQTPTYERWIAMFNQKTLTQDHWDTQAALEHMQKMPYPIPKVKVLEKNDDWHTELVVDFPQFEVVRLHLKNAKAVYATPSPRLKTYQLLFVCQGNGVLRWGDGAKIPLEKEDALFLPHDMGAFEVQPTLPKGMSVLFAVPKMQGEDAVAAKAS